MGTDHVTGGARPRGRVVMLVDNGVHGDSRVQKVARSAAEAGWEVTLLGRGKPGPAQTWKLGDAEVRLVPMAAPLAKRRHEFRRRWLRGPLAYPPNGIAAQRTQWIRAQKAELAVRAAELAAPGARSPGLARAALSVRSLAVSAMGRWVTIRRRQLSGAQKARRRLDTPVDRLYTAFWLAVLKNKAWRRLEPGLWDFELAYGDMIDELAPDLIHAHDFRMLGVGARAAIRARAAGREVKLVWDAHEFLPGLSPWRDDARWRPANCAHESEYAPYADAVITVSESLAELLQQRHKLAELPAVVLNAPAARHEPEPGEEPAPSIRERCGLGPDTPLLVYSGGVSPARGIDTMIDALPQLPGVHAAVVAIAPGKPVTPTVKDLLARAEQLGVADRVHLLPYVPHWQVASFLSSADVGVIPIHHKPNHEIALITKFFEYSHAGLPLVVSDVRTMAEMVRATGQGEVFTAQDTGDFIRAVRAVLADPRHYRDAYDKPGLLAEWTWEAQAEVLDGVYGRLLPGRPRTAAPTTIPAQSVPAQPAPVSQPEPATEPVPTQSVPGQRSARVEPSPKQSDVRSAQS